MNRWTVVKSTSRKYGYSLKNNGPYLSYVIGPGQTCGWYKYKYFAQQRADALNRARENA